MVLSGQVNKSIVAQITSEGGRAVGLSGKDGGLVRVKKLARTKRDPDSNIEKVVDLGFVGEPEQIDPYILEAMSDRGIIPVVAPIGWDAEGNTYNINADTVAGALAGALNASRLLMLTDVSGVLDKSRYTFCCEECEDSIQGRNKDRLLILSRLKIPAFGGDFFCIFAKRQYSCFTNWNICWKPI